MQTTPKPTKKTAFCVEFNDPTDLEGFGPCPGDYSNIWIHHSTNNLWSDDPINPLSSDTYLHLKDQMESSLACGTGSDYTGDWSLWTEQTCYDLCFDISFFFVCTVGYLDCDDTRVRPSIRLQGGPPNFLQAEFVANNIITDMNGSNPGWHRICAPLGALDSNGDLPSNDDGYWTMKIPHDVLSGSTLQHEIFPSPNSAWEELLSDVTAIMLPIDHTGQTSERVGWDNICLVERENDCDPPTESVRR